MLNQINWNEWKRGGKQMRTTNKTLHSPHTYSLWNVWLKCDFCVQRQHSSFGVDSICVCVCVCANNTSWLKLFSRFLSAHSFTLCKWKSLHRSSYQFTTLTIYFNLCRLFFVAVSLKLDWKWTDTRPKLLNTNCVQNGFIIVISHLAHLCRLLSIVSIPSAMIVQFGLAFSSLSA